MTRIQEMTRRWFSSQALSRVYAVRGEISTPMGLQVFDIEVQTGLRLIMIRRTSLAKKPAAATKPPAKKPAARTVKAKAPALVVTLKHIAAEIAEAHEVPKTRAETMLADTVDRLAKHLVKGNKVRIVGLGIFQVKRREARMGRNPQTGEPVKIKASKKVTFRAGKELKEAV
jgi:DNA-binding protein HU-beta